MKPDLKLPECPYRSRKGDEGQFHCSIGIYGYRPYYKHCLDCVTSGNNTPEYAEFLRQRGELSHPPDAPRVSGCCDRADQA